MPFTRSQARAEREKKENEKSSVVEDILSPLEKKNEESLARSRELQKNVETKDDPAEAEKWREAHRKALEVCLKDPALLYQCPSGPIFGFFILNEEIQKTENPWLLTKEGYSPSSYTYEILDRHVECLRAWRQWRGNVPL